MLTSTCQYIYFKWTLYFGIYSHILDIKMEKRLIQTNNTIITLGFVFPTGFLSLLNVSEALSVLAFSVELEKINIQKLILTIQILSSYTVHQLMIQL